VTAVVEQSSLSRRASPRSRRRRSGGDKSATKAATYGSVAVLDAVAAVERRSMRGG
jgi:hypothetical protein